MPPPRPPARRVPLRELLLVVVLLVVPAACGGGSGPDGGGAEGAGPPGSSPVPGIEGARYIERDSVRVVFWGESSARLASRTLDAALAPMPLPGLHRSVAAPRSTIFLAPDPAAYDSLTRGAPAWAAGVAIPASRTIILPGFRRAASLGDAVVTLRHELAHLALHQNLDRIPRWFDEGYATWVSGGWDESSGWEIRLALLGGNAPALDSLALAWPRTEARARLAYLLSASAVRHLATARGTEAFDSLVAAWQRDGSLELAMRSVYQMSPTQFEREWRAMVRRRYGWLLALSQLSIFWIVIVVLVLVLGSARRKRNRERLEALRREEYMLPASTGPGVDADSGQG